MTDDVVVADDVDENAGLDQQPSGNGLRRSLILVLVLALAVLIGGGGWLLGHHSATSAAHPSATSVDAGFSRDMSTHHQQAVNMAIFERKYSTDPNLQLLAYDIEDTQVFQMGEMQGWLSEWNLSRQSSIPQMAWMGTPLASGERMPGMASPAQLDTFESLRGKKLDVMFLQLMLRHHQGGVQMAQYAMKHASESYVRALASSMYSEQSAEIIQMEQDL